MFVLEVKTHDLREIYEVRESVESTAASRLLDGSPQQIKDTCEVLTKIVGEMAKQVATSDWQTIARLDMQFHSALVAGMGNSRFTRIYKTLAAESRMCILDLEVSYPRIDVLVQEHQNILDLLEAGDRKSLLEAIRRHMQKAVEDLTARSRTKPSAPQDFSCPQLQPRRPRYNRQSTRGGTMDSKFKWQEQRTTTPDGVYRVLRTAILDGTVPPGEQLRETHIAADLGISRSPLREALTRLEEEGLVVKIPFKGSFVMEVSARDVAEIASIRLLVEPYAAELSAATLRGPERLRLKQTIEELYRATDTNDIPASVDAHLRFHRLFYEFSGNAALQVFGTVGRTSCVSTSRSTIRRTATSMKSPLSTRDWLHLLWKVTSMPSVRRWQVSSTMRSGSTLTRRSAGPSIDACCRHY